MLNKLQKRNSEGFTIIEVMIVLAVAALILLIVLLAVPALQRNSRNTQRKNDVSSLVSSISEYVNNAGGQLPTTAAQITGNWKPGFYTTGNVTYTVNGAATIVGDPGDTDKVNIGTYSECNSANTASIAGTSSRQVAITYDIETSSGKMEQCAAGQ